MSPGKPSIISSEQEALRRVLSVHFYTKCVGTLRQAGARTALGPGGFAHYVSSAESRAIGLYGDEWAPWWFGELPTKTRFEFHNAREHFFASRSLPMTGRL